MKREKIILLGGILVLMSCTQPPLLDAIEAEDAIEEPVEEVEQQSLVSEEELNELDSFENFEDKFSAAVETSVVGNFIGKGRAAKITIYFDFDSAFLALDGRKALDKIIVEINEAMKRNSATRVRIEGHTDERGSDEYNLALGQRRADSVTRYMLLQGVPVTNVEAVSYGEIRPVRTDSGEIAWQENRRVEINY